MHRVHIYGLGDMYMTVQSIYKGDEKMKGKTEASPE